MYCTQPGVTFIRNGHPEIALPLAPHQCSGHISASGQYHFYLETQAAVASPGDGDCLEINAGTQHASTYQAFVSRILNIPQNKINVGGGFGGKLTHGIPAAAAAALAASKLRRTVRVFNTRTADMQISGGREAFSIDYSVGFTREGVITALQ